MIKKLRRLVRKILNYKKDLLHRFRMNKKITNVLGYEYYVNHKKIDLITAYRCNCKCFDCSQNCRQAPSNEKMTIGQIKRFIKESIINHKNWKQIGVYGGESLLEKDTIKILKLLVDYKKDYLPKLKIRLTTNGLGKIVNQQLKKVPEEIWVVNNRRTSVYNDRFVSINLAPIDFKEYKNADFRNGCYVLKKCGMSLTRYGYYACPNIGAIDRVFGLGLGRKKLPNQKDNMREQLDALCRYCGMFLYKNYDNNEPGLISKTYKKQLNKYKNNKPKLTIY